MRFTHYFQPLVSFNFIGADHGAYFVIQNLGSGSRKGSETSIYKPFKEIGYAKLCGLSPLKNFQRRKSMNMHIGYGRFYCTANVNICFACIFGMNSALHANLGSTAIPGL